MNYRILIVDDEPDIAEGIEFLIHRLCPECQVVGLAGDGIEGYEKACELRPDMILTDIRMPECCGLDMIRHLQQAGVFAKYIVLSGYAEFEYAKTAITLGVEEFITKPVEEDKLKQVLNRVEQAIEKEQEASEKMKHMKRTVDNYVLKEFLGQAGAKSESIRQYLEQFEFPISGKWYFCIVMELEHDFDRAKWKEHFCAETVTGVRLLELLHSYRFVEYAQSLMVLMGAVNRELDPRALLEAAVRLKQQVTQVLGGSINMGIGTMYRSVDKLPQSFEEAICALNYKMMKGPDCVISYAQIRDIEDDFTSPVSQEEIRRLEECIDRMDDAGCKAAVEDIFRTISSRHNLSMEELQMISLNLILSGIRKIPFVQFQMNQYLGKNIFSLESISKFQTMEQLKNWIINTLRGMNELMLKDHLPEKKDVIQEAKEFIAKNFNREIGLNELSERFFINPYYFSQLFKKKTGETYQNYLIGLRVERAKKLLEETDLKIYEVCELVGYSDANHFNKVFERTTGMKPSEYRKRKR